MRAGEAAEAAGVTVKALRHYEAVGLLSPARQPNGYRDYSTADVRIVIEIRELTSVGFKLEETKPFLDCLRTGHAVGDDCPESLAMYQHKIDYLDGLIIQLKQRREELDRQLHAAAARGFPSLIGNPAAPGPRGVHLVPVDASVPADDGAVDRVVGSRLPALTLRSTNGRDVPIAEVTSGRWVLFIYPLTGRPGVDMPAGWDQIPGARGCTQEACGFRDNLPELNAAGVGYVFGASTNPTEYQRELVNRLGLPYTMLSDPEHELAQALRLPMFDAGGRCLYRRLTMILRGPVIEHVFYPVHAPDRHAEQVVAWLHEHPSIVNRPGEWWLTCPRSRSSV